MTPDNNERSQVGWSLWRRWVLSTVVVPFVVIAAGASLALDGDDDFTFIYVALFLGIPLILASIAVS